MSLAGPSLISVRWVICLLKNRQQRSELFIVLRQPCVLPGSFVCSFGSGNLAIEPFRDSFAVFHHYGANPLDAEAADEAMRALQILRVFAIVLNKAAHKLQNSFMGIDSAKHVALADGRTRRAADVDFPLTAFDGHRADVLDHRLRAVARTSGGRELQLVRAVETLKFVFDFQGKVDAVAQTEAAEIRTDAALAGSVAFAVGIA